MKEDVISKVKLIQKIEASRQRLEDTLEKVDYSEMTAPGVVGMWSIKDLLAHLNAWERMMVGWLEDYQQGVPVERPVSDAEFDQWNERIYQENKNKPLEEVLGEFRDVHAKTLNTLGDAPEEALFEAGHFAYRGGLPLWQMVAGNTWWHYNEHGGEIRKWLQDLHKP